MSIDPREVRKSILSLLSADLEGEHSYFTAQCPACRAWWQQACALPQDLDLPELEDLVRQIPGKTHPGESCIPCEGCRVELETAMQAAALGLAGYDYLLAWGPGHPAGSEHVAEQSPDCGFCSQWQADRLEVRAALTALGLDADYLLGDSDDPSEWVG